MNIFDAFNTVWQNISILNMPNGDVFGTMLIWILGGLALTFMMNKSNTKYFIVTMLGLTWIGMLIDYHVGFFYFLTYATLFAVLAVFESNIVQFVKGKI